jgi:hypothetical protein
VAHQVFAISTALQSGLIVNKRISIHHRRVYHGIGKFVNKINGHSRRYPSLTNENRDRIHLSRSGMFVPQLFCPMSAVLVVSAELKKRLEHLPGIAFLPVVFEHLVELELPMPGESTVEDLDSTYDFQAMIQCLPDIGGFHMKVGEFFYVLTPEYSELPVPPDDAAEVQLSYGRFFTSRLATVPLSLSLLKQHSIYRVFNDFLLTEEAFELIATSIDPNYFCVDAISLHPRIEFSE